MDAVNLSTECWFTPCSGSGPWVQADMEDGLFAGGNGSDTNNKGNGSTYVTALLKNNGQNTYAVKGGNSRSGGLTTWYSGAEPNLGGYAPMHQEGAILLGIGGDNSKSSVGSFFEGVMSSGYPTDAADNAVQANIVAAGYGQSGSGAFTGPVIGAGSGKCLDVPDGSNTEGTVADIWPCDGGANQQWTVNANGTITSTQSGLCFDVTGTCTADGALAELWTCNGGSNQKWSLG